MTNIYKPSSCWVFQETSTFFQVEPLHASWPGDLTVEAHANGCTHRDALHGGWGYDGYDPGEEFEAMGCGPYGIYSWYGMIMGYD